MDNTRNNNDSFTDSSQMNSQIKSKLLPIYIIKKNASGTKVIGQKKVNFQINFGKTYHIKGKYFVPKGFHLSPDSKPEVTCKYDNQGINIHSITFICIQDFKDEIQVTYINIHNGKKIKSGLAKGTYGQKIDVTDQVKVPADYILYRNQQTIYQVVDHPQSIDLMLKSNSHPVQHRSNSNNSKAVSTSSQLDHGESNHQNVSVKTNASHPLHHNIENSVKSLENSLQKYDYDVAVQLLHEVLNHDLAFFKKVITDVFTKMKYKGVNNLKTDADHHKISGVIKKCRYNNNHINFTFVRALKSDVRDYVTISEVRDFVTSVMDHNSSKGVFITTSRFTDEAQKEAERHSIILIDGMRLAQLMIDNDVGVKPKQIFRIVNLDKDFF